MQANSYWRNKLSLAEQQAFDCILKGMQSGTFCELKGIQPQAVQNCFEAVMNDHPEVFWVCPQYNLAMQSGPFGQKLIFQSERLYSEFEISRMQNQMKKIAELCFDPNPEKAEKNLVEWIVRNTSYAIDNRRNQNAAAALVYRKAQCSGIARATKYLCDMLGIWCIIISGTVNQNGRAEPHLWNIVRADGIYYHLDVTLMIGSNPNKSGKLFYAGFHYNDTQISETHAWDRTKAPLCNHISPDAAKGTSSSCEPANGAKRIKTVFDLKKALREATLETQRKVTLYFDYDITSEQIKQTVTRIYQSVLQECHLAGSARMEIRGKSCALFCEWRGANE